MEILPMLARLEHALDCANLTKQMLLIPNRASAPRIPPEEINLVVGYNDSPRSQTALDLTLWIAHQTRLASRRTVTVQVVYVVDLEKKSEPVRRPILTFRPLGRPSEFDSPIPVYASGSGLESIELVTNPPMVTNAPMDSRRQLPKLPQESVGLVEPMMATSTDWQIHQFEQADRILWQARHLATEWRGSLETHLRFGSIAQELHNVACKESATVLILGCSSIDHPIVQDLGKDLPCPVLGIPAKLCKF